ncbi:hypothetical protein B0H11DRAFT_1912870 [Mycena galericulata]|nr:hypothetical protein B0H11DRAFT_1912870 [Mycena galericulata]
MLQMRNEQPRDEDSRAEWFQPMALSSGNQVQFPTQRVNAIDAVPGPVPKSAPDKQIQLRFTRNDRCVPSSSIDGGYRKPGSIARRGGTRPKKRSADEIVEEETSQTSATGAKRSKKMISPLIPPVLSRSISMSAEKPPGPSSAHAFEGVFEPASTYVLSQPNQVRSVE